MRKEFEQSLKKYSDLAKNNLAAGAPDYPPGEELKQKDVRWLAEQSALRMSTKLGAQGAIYRLQLEKQRIMADLQKKLKQLNDPEYKPEKLDGQREVKMVGDKFVVSVGQDKKEDKKIEITLGEILTDGEWGIDYYLNPETVRKNIRKKYEVLRAKQAVRSLLYQQMGKMGGEAGTTPGTVSCLTLWVKIFLYMISPTFRLA